MGAVFVMKNKLRFLLLVLLPALLCAGCAAQGNAAAPAQDSGLAAPITIEYAGPPNRLAAGPGEYTVAWITDTQHYSKQFPYVFYSMTEYLAQNREMLRLSYVVHTGDLVQDFDDLEQWRVADRAMQTIGDIPTGVLAGNHDIDLAHSDFSLYGEYFGADRFRGQTVFGASHHNNRAHYDLVTLGEEQCLFVYLSYGPDLCCLDFARRAFEAHPDRTGFLCVHEYLDTDLSLRKAAAPLLEHVIRPCPNVYYVLCGHRYNSNYVPLELDDDGDGLADRTVYQIIANYQREGLEGGSGFIRFMRFAPKEGLIKMYTYSPYLDQYNFYQAQLWLEEYTLPLP